MAGALGTADGDAARPEMVMSLQSSVVRQETAIAAQEKAAAAWQAPVQAAADQEQATAVRQTAVRQEAAAATREKAVAAGQAAALEPEAVAQVAPNVGMVDSCPSQEPGKAWRRSMCGRLQVGKRQVPSSPTPQLARKRSDPP